MQYHRNARVRGPGRPPTYSSAACKYDAAKALKHYLIMALPKDAQRFGDAIFQALA